MAYVYDMRHFSIKWPYNLQNVDLLIFDDDKLKLKIFYCIKENYFLRNKFMQFMMGRYGNDHLNRFISITGCVLLLLSIIFSRWISPLLSMLLFVLALVALIVTYYRALSKNLRKRREENAKYLNLQYKAKSRVRLAKEKWTQRKDYKFFRCPACKTSLRVPRGKGKINIVCKKCGNSFQGKT